MEKATVYTKTAKGITQVNQRSASLSKDLMKVLKLIDGKSNFGQLLEKADLDKGALEKALMTLAKDGFARVFETKRDDADPFGGDAAAGGGDDFDFTAPNKLPGATQRVIAGAANDISELVRQQEKLDAAKREREQAHEAARAKARAEAESRAKLEAEAKAKGEAEKKAMEQAQRAKEAAERAKAELESKMREEEARKKAASEAAARALIEQRKKEEEESKRLAEMKARVQQEANERAKAELEAKVREEELRKKIAAEQALLAAAAQKEKEEAEQRKMAEVRVRAEAEAKALADARMRAEAEAAALAKQRVEAEAAAKKQAEEAKGAEAEMKARLKEEIELRIRAEMESLLKNELEEKTRNEMQAQILEEAKLAAKAELEERLREERETIAKAEAEARIKAEQEAGARAEMEAKKRAEAEARAAAAVAAAMKAEAEARRIKAEAEEEAKKLRIQAEMQARMAREAEAKARAEAEARVREQAEVGAKIEAERKAVEAERRAKYEAEARAKIEAEESEKRQREMQATIEAERKGKFEAEARAKLESDARHRSEADTRAAVQAEFESNIEKKAELESKAQAKAYIAAKAKAEEEEEEKIRAEQARKAAEIAAVLRTKVEADHEAPEEGEPAKRRVRRRRKGLVRSVFFALFAGVVLGILALHVIPLRGYAVKVENAMKGWLHDDVSIASLTFRIVPTPHMRLENVSVGKLLDAKATTGRVYLDITTIFGGRLGINRIELDNVTLTNEAVKRIPTWGSVEGKTDAGEIDTIRLKNVKLEMKPTIEPFDADLRFGRDGTFKAAQLRSPSWELGLKPEEKGIAIDLNARNWTLPAGGVPLQISDARLRGNWAGNEIVVPEFEADVLEGKVNGTLRVTWGTGVHLESDLALSRMSSHDLIASFTKDIAVNGRMEGNISLVADAADVESLLNAPRAQGKFKLGEGSISNADLVAVMQSDSAGTRAGVTKFAELAGEFTAAERRISYRNIALQGGVLKANGNVEVGASSALSGHLALEIRSQVAQDRGNFVVTGTVSRPLLKRGS